MASSFLEQKAKAQAEKLEKQYGSSAYGGTTWLNEQISGKKKKKKKEEDIAPVKSGRSGVKTKQVGRYTIGGGNDKTTSDSKDKRTYFTSGALKDGVTVGNIAKTLIGTDTDILENIGTGARKMAENAIDAGLHVASMAGRAFGADSFSDNVEKVIAQDILGENSIIKTPVSSSLIPAPLRPVFDAAKGIKALNRTINGGKDVDDASVLGERSDSLIQTATRVLLTRGLSGAKIPWQAVTGITSYGGEVESALNEDATTGEAGISAAITAGGEVLGEYILGGMVGETGLDDALIKRLSRSISDKTFRNILKFGIKAGGEGLIEEPFSWAIGKIGQKLTYADEKTWKELFASEEAVDELVESVVGGLFVGGVFQGADAVQAKKAGVDYSTGLTENEEKVVNKEYENRLAEEQKNGNKLTEKQKNKLYDAVISDMEKGRISIDTIEEVLGGETYQNYQNTVKNEDSLRETFNQLNRMKQGDMTGEQIDLRNELKEQIKELESQGQRNQLKSQLDSEVMGLAQNTRLAESYNERSRKGQAFEADLTQYDEKQKTVIQKAIDSGILNNTNRTHEFVDMIAKISADKGVLFDFANNQKLKDSGFAIEGKTVNGFVTKDGVTLNIDSAKSLNSVVGHEITHVLEGTEVYNELQNILKTYAESKGEYQSRYDSIAKLYEGVEGANIDAELTADLVGDYLFTDADFIHNLSTNHRNVFQKIYDEIKYLCKVATAGSKEARELEKVRRAFEKAYKEGGKTQKNTADDSGTKYSLNEFEDGRRFVDVSIDQSQFDGLSIAEMNSQAKKVIKSKYAGKVVGIDNTVFVNGKSSEKYVYYPHGTDESIIEAKARASTELDNLIDAGTNFRKAEDGADGHIHPDAVDGFSYFDTVFKVGDQYYLGTINIKNISKGRLFYGVTKVENITEDIHDSYGENPPVIFLRDVSMKDVPQKEDSVKYSVSDSDGRQLSKEQQEYFKDSKVRDENGNLKVVYHGSPADFNTFSLDYLGTNGTAEGYGFYFTDKKSIAENYSKGREGQQNGEAGRLFEVYLDIKKPLSDKEVTMTRSQFKKFLTTLNNQVDADGDRLDVLSNYGDVEWEGLNKVLNYAMEIEYDGSDSDVNLVHSIINGCGDMKTVFRVLRETIGYDGIIVEDATWGNDQKIYLAFHPEQIKNIDNLNPTSDPDIRRSLSDGEAPTYGNYNVSGKDIALTQEETQVGSEENLTSAPASEETVSETESVAPAVDAENVTIEHSVSDLADIAKQGRRENMRGAYTHNGKQYLSDGSFIAEFDTVDESLEQSNDFPIKQAVKELEEAFARKVEGNYDLHTSDAKGFIKVGNSLFGTKRVNAIIRAIENPVFSLANVHGGHEALVVTGDNGRAVLMPVRASGNAYLVYEAQPIAEAAAFPDDLAPMTDDAGRFESLTDEDAPPEMEAPYYEDAPFENGEAVDAADPFADRDVPYGNEGRKQKAYMYENPEVKPFFQAEAYALLEELNNGTKGERWYNDRLFYESGGEEGYGGVSRHQSESIDRLSYEFGLSYDDIEKGLNAIIEDNGAENIAAAKKIEFVINDRLMYGYKPFGAMLPPDAGMPNQDYIALMQDKQRVDSLTDAYAPPVEEDIAPVAPVYDSVGGQQTMFEPPVETPPVNEQPIAPDPAERVAQIRRAEPQKESWWSRTKRRINDVISMTGDKGWAFENLSKKTGNREVEAKYDFMKNRVKGQAQEYLREHFLPIYEKIQATGKEEDFYHYAYHLHNIDRMSLETEAERVRRDEIRKQLDGYTEKQIESIASEVITRNTPQDRVKQIYLAQEYIDLGGAKGKNKPVYGSSVTADVSRKKVAEYEAANPEFKELEQAILEYNKALRDFAVSQGLITQKVADKWAKMYPHYVPIRRTDRQGSSVSVPLDSNRTGVNNPFKRATGGNSDFIPLSDAIAMNTEQIFYSVARNDFGRELMGALETSAAMDAQKSVDAETGQAINAGSLEPGTRVKAHDRENIGTVKAFNRKTGEYTVYFENQQGHSATVKLAGNILTPIYTRQTTGKDVDTSELLEGTETNDNAILEPGKNGQPPQFTVFVKGKPVTFDITEEMYKAMKPAEGILSETYAVPNAIASGYKKVLTEYDPFFALFRNPIKDTKDVLFNSQHAAKTYMTAPKTMKELATKGKYYTEFVRNGGKTNTYYDTKEMAFTDAANEKTNPYRKAADNFEMFWRLSEYIASREAGRSEKVSMLDAARVTTNFGAGGDFTKWLNRNGALFLNPSVQGVMQIGRNAREAYHGGLKGGAILAAKVLATGLGGMFFNWLLWDDDEDYEELSDYVKQNYFVIWKTEDGKFIRIPKGRMEAVIQNGFEQMQNLVTGDDDVDMATFADLVANNLAPNNPLKNNLFSPIQQALSNTAWYGDDIVPTRLQDVPAAEQYDESTDSISKWIGEKANISPYKVNYVLGQYGGGFADAILPMFTPEAEGDTLLAPIRDEFMSDSTMKNQNVSDFYDKVDELTVNANSSKATDEDILMSKYMSAKNSELSELYKQKRDIQNGYLSDAAKYEAVREIQNQINSLAKESLNSYEDVSIEGVYAKVGDVQFRWYEPGEDSTAEPGWKKLTEEQLEKQDEVTIGLGISAAEYWSNKGEYDFAYDYPEKYEFFTNNGISYEDYKNADEDGKRAYTWAYENPGKYTMSKAISDDFFEYYGYKSELNDIKGVDNNGDGRSDSGTAKEKKLAYINGLDLEYGQRLILYRSIYSSKEDKRRYNRAIVDYLNGRDDLTYEDRITILKELDFKVDSKGNAYW